MKKLSLICTATFLLACTAHAAVMPKPILRELAVVLPSPFGVNSIEALGTAVTCTNPGDLASVFLTSSSTYGEEASAPVGDCVHITTCISTNGVSGDYAIVKFYEITSTGTQTLREQGLVYPGSDCDYLFGNFDVSTNSSIKIEVYNHGLMIGVESNGH